MMHQEACWVAKVNRVTTCTKSYDVLVLNGSVRVLFNGFSSYLILIQLRVQ